MEVSMKNNNINNWRQKLHLEPPEGWLNDPNGLSFFNGEYHVYFQHSPGSSLGKTTRCWGHFCGKTLTELSYEGIVLRPDIYEDKNGVYSGSAVNNGNVLHIFYTGNVLEKGDFDYIKEGRGANVIHVTSADGEHMSEKLVVLSNADYPEFCSCHVRDPKVYKADGEWKMVLGARTLDDQGGVLFYKSKDLDNWEYEKFLTRENFGYMWECPDYFKLGQMSFLSVSPQGLPHYEDRFQNVYQSGYFTLVNERLINFVEWDMGFDFYAPQTFENFDGRRIMFAWMGIENEEYGNATTDSGWQHCLTIPNEITLGKGGKLLRNPVREWKNLRNEIIVSISGNCDEENVFIVPDKVELPFELVAITQDDFEISFDERLKAYYDKNDNHFILCFLDEYYGSGRKTRKARLDRLEKIRIIADMSSIEIYINDGEVVFCTRFYPENNYVKVKIQGVVDATIWKLI